MGNGRLVKPLIDFSFPRQALENCRKHHGTFCEIQKPPEIRRILVVTPSAGRSSPILTTATTSPSATSGKAWRDMTVGVVGVEGKVLELEGWVVEGGLGVRMEPFSEVVVPGGGEVMGLVTERNFLHPNTLGTGRYEVLVVGG